MCTSIWRARRCGTRASAPSASIDFVPGEDNRMIAPESIEFDSPYGKVHRLAPMAKLSKTPGKWQEPLLTVRGSDLPVWKDAL